MKCWKIRHISFLFLSVQVFKMVYYEKYNTELSSWSCEGRVWIYILFKVHLYLKLPVGVAKVAYEFIYSVRSTFIYNFKFLDTVIKCNKTAPLVVVVVAAHGD